MQTATLIMSGLGLACSAATLTIVLIGAKKARLLESEVETFKRKTNRNLGRVKAVLGEMEL